MSDGGDVFACVCTLIICGSFALFATFVMPPPAEARAEAEAEEIALSNEYGGNCYGLLHVIEPYDCDTGGYYRRLSDARIAIQKKECVCATNNTCTWAYDGVCDDVTLNANGVCAPGTDCEDCGTCNWYDCVLKEEVPKPKTMYKSESTAGDVLDAGPIGPPLSPAFLF